MKIPTSTLQLEPWVKRLIQLLTLFAIVFPVIVLIGWITGNKSMVMPREDFYPMTFNTAFILTAIGLSVILQTFNQKNLAIFSILIAIIMSAAFGFESITGINLGIDEALFKLNIHFPFEFRPRPAGYTSLCALLLSLGLLCLYFRDKTVYLIWLASLLGVISLCLSLMILYGFLGSFEQGTYSFDGTRVAVHTAFSLLLLSISCLYLSFHSVSIYPKHAVFFYFCLGFALSMGIAFATNYAWLKQAKLNLERVLKIHAAEMANILKIKLKETRFSDVQFKKFLEIDEEHLDKFIQSDVTRSISQEDKFNYLLLLNADGSIFKNVYGGKVPDRLKSEILKIKDAPEGYYPLKVSDKDQFLALKLELKLENGTKKLLFIYDTLTFFNFKIHPDLAAKLTRIKIYIDGKESCLNIISPEEEKAVAYSSDSFMNLNYCILLGGNERFLKEFSGTLGAILMTSGIVIGFIIGWHLYLLQKSRKLVEELIKADNAKTLFFANVSHEIRTPLHGIIGVTSLLKTTNLDTKQTRYLNILDLSSQHLLDLIDNILDITKIESGSLVIVQQACDLEALCLDIVKMFKLRCEEKHLLLNFNYAADAPGEIKLAIGAFKQILINLLGNAVKFTEQGSILLDIHLKALEGNKAEIELKVRDTGIGIPKDKFPVIFTKFARVDEQLSIKKGGTGIGLYLSQLLVKGLGGTIRFESEVNKGSTFYVSLPTEFVET